MFTGLVETLGTVRDIEAGRADTRLRIAAGGLADVRDGDSVAVNGVCLTVAALEAQGLAFDVSAETLSRSTLGASSVGSEVNLEAALTLSARLGGHLVAGHVDGIGEIVERRAYGQSVRLGIRVPAGLERYVAVKGSLCVDGVSLTVNAVEDRELEVNLIPHTLAHTTARHYRTGHRVNLEVDLIARYVERLLQVERGEPARDDGSPSGVTRALLARHGFLGDG